MKITDQNVVWLLIFVSYTYLFLATGVHGKEKKFGGQFPTHLTVGVFLHDENSQAKVAFDSAMYTANLVSQIARYIPVYKYVSKTDSFEAGKSICDLTAKGVGVVFGSASDKISPIIESTCMNLDIPYIRIGWRPYSSGNLYSQETTAVSVFPKTDLLSKGIGVIARHLQWRSFVVLYEDSESLVRLQDVLKIQNFNLGARYNTIMFKNLGPGPDYRPVLKEIKNTTEYKIILDCKTENILNILTQAKEVKLLLPFYNYFLTSLDAHTVNLKVLDTKANITTIRIINFGDENTNNAIGHWRQYADITQQTDFNLDDFSITTETALMHDAVELLGKTIRHVVATNPVFQIGLNCSERKKWDNGLLITSIMKEIDHIDSGITGPIKFDKLGHRTNFTIYVIEGNEEDVLATWCPDNKNNLFYIRSDSDRNLALEKKLREGKLIVSSRIGAPYLIEKKSKDGEILEGNDRYEGFSMDLITALANELNFKFRFELAADKKYGNYDEKTKSWNGLIKDILDRKADLAICDLTITHERREVVDFSAPFMRLGISILYKKEDKKDINMFAFLDPLSIEVWIYTATLYLTVTLIIYFIARGSSADWENPHPCDHNPEELENIWTLKNCFWLTLGAIMNQGCDILPKGISSRMAAASWWFFAIIVTNSYMANLAAFLTMEGMKVTISSAEDLAKQSKIKYGTLRGGSTEAFFKNTNYSVYQKMWTAMVQAKPTVFENNNEDGVNRVLNTRNRLYAYLIESTTLEYQLQTQCDLMQVGGLLDNKGYGIAMPLDYPFRSKINEAILKLQENGKINQLKEKWWVKKRDAPSCPKDTGGGDSQQLSLRNVGGVFLVLGVGVGLAYLVALIEFLWNVKNVAVEEHITYWQALKIELKFALMVWVTKKRTKPQLCESPSSHSDTGSGIIARSILQGAGSFLQLNNIVNKSPSPSRQSRRSN